MIQCRFSTLACGKPCHVWRQGTCGNSLLSAQIRYEPKTDIKILKKKKKTQPSEHYLWTKGNTHFKY